jgi:hypothetical protein
MKTLTELTSSTETASWIPDDAYADLILGASVDYGKLSGVITAVDYDMRACQGDTIQVRYVPARTAQGPKDPCACLSSTSSTVGSYSIQVKAYGDYDTICGFTEFETCGPLKERIMDEMAKGLAKKRDQVIWTELTQSFTPTYTYTTKTAPYREPNIGTRPAYDSTATLIYDLYNGIINLKKQLEGAGLNPDYVIMHPEIAAFLYYKDNGAVPPYATGTPLVKFDGSKLVEVAGLKVIETANASTATELSGATMAVIIDSSRAVGEAWGKRPVFTEFYENDCDRTKVTIWMYWGTSEMDTSAIGHIINP